MNFKLYSLLAVAAAVVLPACTDTERIDVQPLKTYDEQYYQNVRDFKKTDHEVSFAYYEAWSPIEGVDGYKDPASWGERIKGLPDSIDIVNLWMGIPTPETHPIAYSDMRWVQANLGTRFVMHADASHYRHQFTAGGKEYNMQDGMEGGIVSDEMMEAYALYIRESVASGDLNGVDIDFEGWSNDNLIKLVKILARYWGPQGENPEMLLIVDYFSAQPSSECEPYCDYFVQQAYSDQVGFLRPSGNYPIEKQIFCEQFGNGTMGQTGAKLAQYAAWEPGDGTRKGGCGVYYLGRNYYSNSGIPYFEFRQAIQIMNPAVPH